MSTVYVERRIHIELSEREATVLCALLGGISSPPVEVADLFEELDGSLPNRAESFMDLFHIAGDRLVGSGAPEGS
jgi:hypothetical protein